jgi:hypothetical protein
MQEPDNEDDGGSEERADYDEPGAEAALFLEPLGLKAVEEAGDIHLVGHHIHEDGFEVAFDEAQVVDIEALID